MVSCQLKIEFYYFFSHLDSSYFLKKNVHVLNATEFGTFKM